MTKFKGPFLVKEMGDGKVLYQGWNPAAVGPALKQATGTTVLTTGEYTMNLTVADCAFMARAFAK